MPISYVGGRTFFFAGTTTDQVISLTTLTGGSDTAPQAGDFVVVFYGSGSNTSRTLSITGYTSLGGGFISSTTWTNNRGGYKFMGATPDTTVTVSGTGSTSDGGAGTIHVFRGVDTTTPLDVAVVLGSSGTTTRPDPGSITPVTAGAWIVAAGQGGNTGGASTTFSSSDLTSFITVSSNDTFDVTVGGGIKTDWTSGAFDPAQFTYSGTDSTLFSNRSFTVALRPSPNVTVYPTGVSATGRSGSVYVDSIGTIGYVGGKTLGIAGTTATTNVSLTDLTGGFASAPAAGDFVVVSFAATSSGTAPSGISIGSSYTNLSVVSGADSYSPALVVGYKFMGSTPDTSVTVSQTFSNNNGGAVTVQVFRNVYTVAPLGVAPTSATAIDTFLPNPPPITPDNNSGTVIVAVGAGGTSSLVANAAYSSSDLTSFLSVAGIDLFSTLLGAGYARWVSGTYDPAAFTANVGDSATSSCAAYTLALQPYNTVINANPSVTGVSATGRSGSVYVPSAGTIDYVGGTTLGIAGTLSSTNVSLTSLTGGFASAPEAGDFVVVSYGVTASVSPQTGISVGSSYTNLAVLGQADSVAIALAVGYKFMGVTPDTTVSVSQTFNTADGGAVAVQVFRGVDQTTPLDVTSTSATAANTLLANPPSITPVTANAVVVGAGAGSTGAVITSAAAYSSSNLSPFISTVGLDNRSALIGLGSAYWTSGAFDPAAFTANVGDSAAYASAAYTLALRPSAGSPDVTASVTGVSATGEVGTAVAVGDSAADATGVSGTGEVGDVTVSTGTNVDVPVTGVEATGQAGTADATGDATADATGVSATGDVGTVTVDTGGDATVSVTGVSASGEVGTVTAIGDATADATGVSGSGEVGTVTVVISVDVTVSVTGVEATGQVGTATATGDAAVDATGVSATGQVGTATAVADVTADATGVSATGEVGTVTVTGDATADTTGVSATGELGEVSVTGDGTTDVTGVSATGNVGSVVVIPSVEALVTGVSASGAAGTVTVIISEIVEVTGVFATGRVTGVLVWGPITPSQTPGYAAVAPTQNPGYSPVTPGQTPGWTPVAT